MKSYIDIRYTKKGTGYKVPLLASPSAAQHEKKEGNHQKSAVGNKPPSISTLNLFISYPATTLVSLKPIPPPTHTSRLEAELYKRGRISSLFLALSREPITALNYPAHIPVTAFCDKPVYFSLKAIKSK